LVVRIDLLQHVDYSKQREGGVCAPCPEDRS